MKIHTWLESRHIVLVPCVTVYWGRIIVEITVSFLCAGISFEFIREYKG
jgi:hypothetical protein